VILAKDVRRTYATNIDFFFTNGELSIVLNDEDGVLRVFTYDPSGTFFLRVDATISTSNPRCRSRLERGSTSHVSHRVPLPQGVSSVPHNRATNEGGQRDPASEAHHWYALLCSLTFHLQPYSFLLPRLYGWHVVGADARRRGRFQTTTFPPGSTAAQRAARRGSQSQSVPVSVSIPFYPVCAPVVDPNLGTSIVRNDTVSKPMSRGILDGQLLELFEELGVQGQQEMTRQIGTERMAVLRDWSALAVPW